MGLGWLAASGLVVASAVMAAVGSRHLWWMGALALIVSQAVIMSAWRDAWAGTIANVVLLLIVTYGWFDLGPRSFQAQFDRDVATGLARASDAPLLTDADLAPLPEPVRRYLQLTGSVGQPRVRNYQLRFRGRIRIAPDSAWMPFDVEQQSFADRPTRLFHMRARLYGVPVDGKTFTPLRFSTPVRDYRAFGPLRLASYGEARWRLPEGEFVYGEFTLQELVINADR